MNKIKQNLIAKYNQNHDLIKEINEKIYLLTANTLESRILNISLLTLPLYLITTLLIIPSDPIINLIQNYKLSFQLLSIMNIIPTLSISIILEHSLNKKKKIKQRLQAFSQSKTSLEKLQEQIKYEIEREKIETHNKIISKNLKDLKNSELVNYIPSPNHNPTTSETKTIKELQVSISQNKGFLKKQYQKLDHLTTKNILTNKMIFTKSQKYNIIFSSLIIGTILMLYCNIPQIIILKELPESFLIKHSINFFELTLPLIIGTTTTCIYNLKKYILQKRTIQKLNHELLDNSLSNPITKQEIESLEKELKVTIDTIHQLELHLQNQEFLLAKQLLNNSNNLSQRQKEITQLKEIRTLFQTPTPSHLKEYSKRKKPTLVRKKIQTATFTHS